MIHKKEKEDEDEDERVVLPPVSCNLHPTTAGAATAGAATEVLRQQVLRQRAGGGTSPRRVRLLAAPKDRGAHARSRMLHRQQLHQVVVAQGGHSLQHLLGGDLLERDPVTAEKSPVRRRNGSVLAHVEVGDGTQKRGRWTQTATARVHPKKSKRNNARGQEGAQHEGQTS